MCWPIENIADETAVTRRWIRLRSHAPEITETLRAKTAAYEDALKAFRRTLQEGKMEKPLVTLLLPCYNCEKTLDRFMRSVISESYHPLELICIDDGSTDDTAKLLKTSRRF